MKDFQACYCVVGEFARLTRRAAAYRVAAATHLNNSNNLMLAVRDLLSLDPDFDPKQFVLTEFYKDRSIAKYLETELKRALSTTSLRLAG